MVHAPPEHDQLQTSPAWHSNVQSPPEHDALHVSPAGQSKSHWPVGQSPLQMPLPHVNAVASPPASFVDVVPVDQS